MHTSTLRDARGLRGPEEACESIWLIRGRSGLYARFPPHEVLEKERAVQQPIQCPESPEG